MLLGICSRLYWIFSNQTLNSFQSKAGSISYYWLGVSFPSSLEPVDRIFRSDCKYSICTLKHGMLHAYNEDGTLSHDSFDRINISHQHDIFKLWVCSSASVLDYIEYSVTRLWTHSKVRQDLSAAIDWGLAFHRVWSWPSGGVINCGFQGQDA